MSDMIDHLFQPLRVGNVTIRNRIVLPPLSRHRSHLDGAPTPLNLEYYRQRAGAGLIITEGAYPSDMGKAYLYIPGICNEKHVAGWRTVTDAVHQAGGAIFCQIMHSGRLSDPLILPDGAQPIGPSAVQPDPTARHYTVNCPRPIRGIPYMEPRAMTIDEVKATVGEYRAAAERALCAGFDGVEIHAGSGYLPNQFLSMSANLRTDAYGGSIENRARFLIECVEAMSEVNGSGFVAVRVSPGFTFQNVYDDDPIATYSYVARALSGRGLAYFHVGNYGMDWDVYGTLRPLFDGPFMVVGGFTRQSAAEMIANGGADMVGFGQAFIANPDLPDRFRRGLDISRPSVASWYTQGAEGYTDYPDFAGSASEQLMPVDSQITPLAVED